MAVAHQRGDPVAFAEADADEHGVGGALHCPADGGASAAGIVLAAHQEEASWKELHRIGDAFGVGGLVGRVGAWFLRGGGHGGGKGDETYAERWRGRRLAGRLWMTSSGATSQHRPSARHVALEIGYGGKLLGRFREAIAAVSGERGAGA